MSSSSYPEGYYNLDAVENLLIKFHNNIILKPLMDRIYNSNCLFIKLEILITNPKLITGARNFIKAEEDFLKMFTIGELIIKKPFLKNRARSKSYAVTNIHVILHNETKMFLYLLHNFRN